MGGTIREVLFYIKEKLRILVIIALRKIESMKVEVIEKEEKEYGEIISNEEGKKVIKEWIKILNELENIIKLYSQLEKVSLVKRVAIEVLFTV